MLYYLVRELLEGRHYAYENPLFRGTLAALLCFVVTLLGLPRVIRQLIKWKLGDHPQFDHVSLNELTRDKSNIPTMGGMMMLASIALALLLLADLSNFYVRMGLVCLVWLGGLGAVDDWLKLTAERRSASRDGLKMYEKLLFQIALGVILGFYIYYHGGTNFAVLSPYVEPMDMPSYRILNVPFYKAGLQLGTFAFMIVTVVVMTATSNAVNLTDGMDGLASGCVAMCAFVFVILTYIVGTQDIAHKLLFPYVPKSGELVILCGAVFGASLGFLWHNCHPAKVFMGDTGSLPLGGLIGYVAVVTRQELMLLIAGGVFVMEAFSVITQVGYFKWTGGRRLFRCAPVHHHFHLGGWSEPQTVVRFWLIAIMFAALALATIKLR
ncbi:MAG: phospho-N-acetylmuramoyl-pentapeptide-transferase [Phycisphaerales bacterium]|nr:MAG: phospho-N-acetylmuramoyl-pentapeptide-transferase [Phycisphaerales bacterium]